MKTYNPYYQQRTEGVINNALSELTRIMALRVDLRLPPDYPDSPDDSKVITRFFDSLKAKLRYDTVRKASRWGRNLNNPLYYVWVREYGEMNNRRHYHLVLFVNKDIYHSPGVYNGENNLASFIQQAWCSATGLRYPAYSRLVHFPEHGVVYLDRNSPELSAQLAVLKQRTDYLAKDHTKPYHDGFRSFGTSR